MSKVRARPETGLLYLDFFYRGARCREQTAMADVPANRAKAERLLQRIERDIAQGTFVYAHVFPNSPRAQPVSPARPVAMQVPSPLPAMMTPTLEDFAETWFSECCPRWRQSYQATVRHTLNKHVIPELGDRPVGEIARAELLAFRARLSDSANRKRPRSASLINRIMTITRMILAEASDRYEVASPFRNIKPLRLQRTDVQPFTLEEVHRLIETVREDYRSYLIVRFFTGLRTAEIHGLKWQYVDFEKRQILVRETWVQQRTEYTKTDGSQREIPMLPVVYEALQEQRRLIGKNCEYVFANRDGLPLDAHNFTNRIWYPLLRHLGLAKRRPYQTRHTAATLMLASGESPEWIAKILGHSSTDMLFKVYSRFVPNLTRQDGRAYAGLIQAHMPERGAPSTDVAPSPPSKRTDKTNGAKAATGNLTALAPTKFGRLCQIQ